MEGLKFSLSGKGAFYKKPEVNTYLYFTYGTIHKVALLGMLGAIAGYEGYTQQVEKGETYPEFYKVLKEMKVGIVIKNEDAFIPKKVHAFNNSVGYASKETGGNLIVKEQWLEEPSWEIYLLLQGETERALADRLLHHNYEYIPYLGKNDHFAILSDVTIIKDIEPVKSTEVVHSLFLKDDFEFVAEDPFDTVKRYKYEEQLPMALSEATNQYELRRFMATNYSVRPLKTDNLYQCLDQVIYFF